MATRQNRHRNEADQDEVARILNECNRIERKASTSSERAARVSKATSIVLDDVKRIFASYEEAQDAFDAAMTERLELEEQIEAHERELAEAEERQAEADAAELERI